MSFWELDFMRTALMAGVGIGLSLAALGVFLTLRRMAFSGLAVSQWAAFGTVVGVALGWHWGGDVLSLLFVLFSMSFMSLLSRGRRTRPESWVAALYVLGAAAAVLVLSKVPRGESETMGLFFRNILTVSHREVVESLGLLAVTGAALAVGFHRWVWISFDPVSAEVAGLRVGRWTFFFNLVFALAMTLAIHIVGVLLAFAYLLLPAAAGMSLSRRLAGVFGTALATALLATVAGFALSVHWDLPTGSLVAALLALAAIVARGLSGWS